MNATERAEQIALAIHKIQHPGTIIVDWNKTGFEVIDFIAAQITEAEREAVNPVKECPNCHGNRAPVQVANSLCCSTCYDEAIAFDRGFNAAQEQAAGIAEKCFDNDQPGFRLIGQGVADKIRAMTRED